MNNTTRTSFRASVIALAIASMPLAGHAAGLGQINVFSGLGQPLRAEIAVKATAQELATLSANLASPEAFSRARLNYSAAAAAVEVRLDTSGRTPVLRLSSSRPINDPFLELLVELDSSSGRVQREYTILLDPVDLAVPRPLAAAVEAPAVAAPAAQPKASPLPALPPGSYTVRRGDTLTAIAGSTLQPGVTLEQMVVAIYRANSHAFDGNNMNRLRAGAVLSIPEAARAQESTPAQARQEIRAQAADFERFRQGLASAAARQAPEPAPASEQVSAGRIVPRVEETRPQVEEGDQVKISQSDGETAGGAGGAEARLRALEQELAARDRALEEANSRLAQLEASLRDMQKLLELRNAPMAQLQEEASPTQPATEQAEQLPPAVAASAAEVDQALEALLEEAAAADVPAGDSEVPAAAAPVPAPSETDASVASATAPSVDTEAADTAAAASAEAEQAAPAAKPKRKRVPPPPPAAESSLLDFDFDLDSPVPPAGAEMAAFDATTVDLDLDSFAEVADHSARSPVSIEATQMDGLDIDISEPSTILGEAGAEEVDTKLELARAYHDMGDREGANELLQEVIREGSATQQEAARELLAQLA